MPVLVEESFLWFMYLMFLVPATLAAIFGILLAILFIFTPARTWLKSKTKNLPIIAARRRDRKVHHVLATKYDQGLVTTKEYGSFIVDPDSVYVSKKGGVPILPVNAEIGITLNQRVLAMIDGLKRMGIDNIEDAEALNSIWGVCTCGFEGPMEPEIVNKNVVLVCPYHKKEVRNEESDKKESVGEGTAAGNTVHAEDGTPSNT